MCLVCNCTHCADGDCDQHHHAHDWIRKVRDENFPRSIAIAAMANDEGWTPEEAEAYLVAKFDWVKPLKHWLKDDKGGTV